MVPASATVPVLSQPVPMASWRVPYNQLMEEEKNTAQFTDGSVQYLGTTPKWTAIALQSLSDTPERGKEKSSQWIECKAVYFVIHFACKEKWPDM